MVVTPLLTAVLALIYVFLSVAFVRQRFGKQVSLGDGGDKDLTKAIRIHSSFIEYVPISILLFWFLESVVFDSGLVAILGAVLIVCRIMHIVGMQNPGQYIVLRQIGIVGTLCVIIVAAVRITWHYVPLG